MGQAYFVSDLPKALLRKCLLNECPLTLSFFPPFSFHCSQVFQIWLFWDLPSLLHLYILPHPPRPHLWLKCFCSSGQEQQNRRLPLCNHLYIGTGPWCWMPFLLHLPLHPDIFMGSKHPFIYTQGWSLFKFKNVREGQFKKSNTEEYLYSHRISLFS